MGEQEAKVRFTEDGSQNVIQGFKGVGDAAGNATTKVSGAGDAIKNVGTGMKSAVSNIGATVTAFATLALSVVSTWRAYRDLNDAQLSVDKANFKVKTSTDAVTAAQKLVDKIKASSNKTDLKAVAANSAIIAREEALNKKRKAHSITNKQAKAEQDAINLARSNIGTDKAALLAKAEQDLANKKEKLGFATESAAQKQKHFNDATQDFYLSLLPTAISVIGTAVSGFESLKNIVGSGNTGIVGSLGGLGLVLGGASVALLAYQNNWLGFRDIVGGAIDWIKERLGVWKETLGKIFELIKSGDWGSAFNLIKEAAVKFWTDLKTSVPLFGFIDGVIANIRNGQWGKAFDMIKQAAIKFWADMKKAVPFLADIETFINDIQQAKWDDVFKAIVTTATKIFNETIGKGIEFFFGKNWKSGLDAFLALQEAEASVNKRPLTLQYLITINGIIKDITGIDIAKWFKEHPFTASSINLPLSGITLSIEDPDFQAALKKGAEVILGALGTALSTATKTLDPYIATVVKALNWNTAITSASDAIKNAGEAIWIWIFSGIKSGFSGQDWSKLFADFPAAVNEAWAKNAPETQKAIFENFKTSLGAKVLGGLGIKIPATLEAAPGATKQIQDQVSRNPVQLKSKLDTAGATKDNSAFKNRLERQQYIAKMKLDTQIAAQNLNKFVNKANNTTVTIKVATKYLGTPLGNQILKGTFGKIAQGGMHESLTRDTIILAHQGERVDIDKPEKMGFTGVGGKGVNVKVYIGNEEFKGYIHTTVNEDQGNSK